MIMITLPNAMANLRPHLSVTSGTIGREHIDPREYSAERRPRMVDLGWPKTDALLSKRV